MMLPPALLKIRREMKRENKALENKVQGILEKWSSQGVLRDSVVNYREGKFVLSGQGRSPAASAGSDY